MAKKLTIEEFDKQVLEALEEPLPGQNGQKRLRAGETGLLRDLLKGTEGETPPIKGRI